MPVHGVNIHGSKNDDTRPKNSWEIQLSQNIKYIGWTKKKQKNSDANT